MDYTKASESPSPFHFWTGVSTIAGALRRRVWIDQRYFQWTPNFYIVLVGPPGVAAKSTSIHAGMKLLERLKIPFGPQSMTWQALTKALEESLDTVKFVSKDGTPEQILMSCLTISISELGTFFKMEDSALMDVLVSLWDGQLGTWSHKTKSSGNVDIVNPWLNIIGCTTPSWLQEHFPEHMIGGGLVSRMIFVFGDKKRQFVAYPADWINPQEYREAGDKLFMDLAEISSMAGEILLADDAKVWGRRWYDEHWTTRPTHMASERYGGYISRKQAHIHKLSIIVAAAKRSRLVIELEDLLEAEQIITSIEADMSKVFSNIGLVDSARQTNEIVHLVGNFGFLPTKDLWKLCMNSMEFRTFQDNVRAAIEAGQVRAETRDSRPGLAIIRGSA
jgi:hypothetical protein